MRTTKGFVFVAQAALSILQKSLCRITQYRQLLSPDIVEIDRAIGVGNRSEFFSFEVSVIGQALEADHQYVAGEGRGGGLRGVSVAHRTKGKNLPERLLSGGKPIDEYVCIRTKIADPTARGQRRRMHQDA